VAASGRVVRLWGPVLLYMVIIYAQSSLNRAPLPAGWSDKLAHLAGYVLMGVLVTRALAGGFLRRVSPKVAVAAACLTALYGATDEWHQTSVEGRVGELADLGYDTAGGVIAATLMWACAILWPRWAGHRASRSGL
jgi:VanZ family protein